MEAFTYPEAPSTYDTIIWFDNFVLLKRLEIVCTLYQYAKNFMTKLQAANKHKTNVMKPEKTKYMERYHINLHQLELYLSLIVLWTGLLEA
jgi:hypothetical protein